MKYFFLSCLVLPCVLFGFGCQNGLVGDQPITSEDAGRHVRGSCNIIASDSHCLDYIGSIWTEQQMQLNCQGVGEFSLEACPVSENGGCLSGFQSETESVIWSYSYGGQPITSEDAQYEAAACEAGPISEWVSADSFSLE